jgi:hypothetical protein
VTEYNIKMNRMVTVTECKSVERATRIRNRYFFAGFCEHGNKIVSIKSYSSL